MSIPIIDLFGGPVSGPTKLWTGKGQIHANGGYSDPRRNVTGQCRTERRRGLGNEILPLLTK